VFDRSLLRASSFRMSHRIILRTLWSVFLHICLGK